VAPLELFDTHFEKADIVSLGTVVDAKLILQVTFKAYLILLLLS
jgi:hypothetical protein